MIIGYWSLLKNHIQFRKLFLANTISLLGDWLNLLALLALMRELDLATPKLLGGLFILKLLPSFLMSPVAGIVADRFPRQTIMILSDLLRFAMVLSYFLAPVFPDKARYWVLGVVAFQAATSAFFDPAKTALLPSLVPTEALPAANGLTALSWSLTYVLGSALGGLLTFFWGWRIALLLDSATYLISAWLIVSMGVKRHPKTKKPFSWGAALGATDFTQGLKYIRDNAEVAYTMSLKAAWGLAGAIPLVLTLYAEKRYSFGGHPDIGTAFLFSCRALGTGIGPVLAGRVFSQNPAGLHWAIWISLALGAAFYAVFGWVNHPLLAGCAVVVAHIGGSVNWVYSTVRLQQIVPDAFRGRVFAGELGLATLAISMSTWFIGFLAQEMQWSLPQLAFLLAGILGASTLLCLYVGRWVLSLGTAPK